MSTQDIVAPGLSAPAAYDSRPSFSTRDASLLPAVAAAVQEAGTRVLGRFSREARPADRQEIEAALKANDAVSLEVLRTRLGGLRPGARWDEDENGGGALPPGEWWVVDPVEGNINHVQGMEDWAVSATLVRDNQPVLAAVFLPVAGRTYTAVRGGGAYENGVRLRVSAKVDLSAALMGTGQAAPGEDEDTHERITRSVGGMLASALVLRMSVPGTLQLIQVAAGRMDGFWQASQVRSGLLAGGLLVAEAGGTVTDFHGLSWSLASDHFLASAPALHPAAVRVLSAVA